MSAVAMHAANDDAADMLQQVRDAWRAKNQAEAKLARLKTYRAMNPSMQREADRAYHQLSAAEATLKRVLEVAA